MKLLTLTLTFIVLLFNACEDSKVRPVVEPSLEQLAGFECATADSSLRSPSTFDGIVSLINSLPKPLTVSCFVFNYDPPFKTYATNNAFSAQPAAGESNPRIFFFKKEMMLSIVPVGRGSEVIEFGLAVGDGMSVKGEIKFPIEESITTEDILASIVDPDSTSQGTHCRFCHRSESIHADGGYVSEILEPNDILQVSSQSLLEEAKNCSIEEEKERCILLKTIYEFGQAEDIEWPFLVLCPFEETE